MGCFLTSFLNCGLFVLVAIDLIPSCFIARVYYSIATLGFDDGFILDLSGTGEQDLIV